MLTTMELPSLLVRRARTRGGMTIRELAKVAGVAASTVQRIEAGKVDPTVGMLARLLHATGGSLALDDVPFPGPRLADMGDAWGRDGSGRFQPDWTRLRGFLDWLHLHPDAIVGSTVVAPGESGSDIMDNLLAAIAETISLDAQLDPPAWTRTVPPLATEWVPDGTPRSVMAWRAAAAEPFLRRGLVVSRDSLWRPHVGRDDESNAGPTDDPAVARRPRGRTRRFS
ncbi:MAG: helix-turn-helix domain-containing protein [Actinomycetota bacterium]